MKTYAEARALVESGEADATIENENGTYQFPAGRLTLGASIEGHWVTDHLAVRKGQPQLLSILNKALEAFPPAELRAIRAKWLSGSPQVHTRLYFNRLAKTTILPMTSRSGTPGAANSRHVDNAGPTFNNLAHSPVVPVAGRRRTTALKTPWR